MCLLKSKFTSSLLFLAGISFVLPSCNSTKYVPEGTYLLKKNQIYTDGKAACQFRGQKFYHPKTQSKISWAAALFATFTIWETKRTKRLIRNGCKNTLKQWRRFQKSVFRKATAPSWKFVCFISELVFKRRGSSRRLERKKIQAKCKKTSDLLL